MRESVDYLTSDRLGGQNGAMYASCYEWQLANPSMPACRQLLEIDSKVVVELFLLGFTSLIIV